MHTAFWLFFGMVSMPQEDPTLTKIRCWPAAISAGDSAEVTFRSTLVGIAREAIGPVYLEQVDEQGNTIKVLGELALQESRREYFHNLAASFTIAAGNPGEYQFRLHFEHEGQSFYSDITPLPISPFPLKLLEDESIERAGTTVSHPESSGQAVADRILVTFAPETSNQRIEAIVARENGKVLHLVSPVRKLFVIYVPPPWSTKTLAKAIEAYQSYPEVTLVEADGIVGHQ